MQLLIEIVVTLDLRGLLSFHQQFSLQLEVLLLGLLQLILQVLNLTLSCTKLILELFHLVNIIIRQSSIIFQ